MLERRSLLAAAGTAAGLGSLPLGWKTAAAQERYPSRPMRIVVPFAAGGATDLFARKFADRATPGFTQPIVVENRGGAGGILGSSEVARAAPDGYTTLFGTASTHGVNPTMMVRPAYDAIRDYSHVAIVGTAPLVVAVNPSVQATNLREMVELVRARPGHYSYATAGVGTITQLAFEWLKQTQNLDVTHVAYRGSNPALMDVLAGTIPLFLETFGPLIEHHRAGRIRIIAVLSAKRSDIFPEIPTAEEVGYPGAQFGTFNVLSLPAGTSSGIVSSLNRTAMSTMRDATLQQELRSLAIEPVTDSTPESATAYVRAEIEKWAPLVRASGARIE